MDCPACRHVVKNSARFCENCGSPLINPDVSQRVGSLGLVSTLPVERLIGRILDGKYRLDARLGGGGMGTVYKARRMRIGDDVAIKIMRAEFVSDNNTLERFRREARIAAGLRHPNIVIIHDFGETNEPDVPAFIVMELLEGASLREVLEQGGRLDLHRAIGLMREICAGVGAAHQNGVLHRDLKPENVMILPPYSESKAESVKVVDFGLARLRNLGSDERLTQVGALIGTPCYMSPEQCRGDDLDTRSDVYTLAGILYEMLSGKHPFIASSNAEIISKHLHQLPDPFPVSLGVPLPIEEVIMQGLLKQAGQRQRDAESFSRELREALEKNPLLVVQSSDIAFPSQSDDKGVLDYQAEIEEAFEEMGEIILKVGEENTKIGQKAAAHSANMQALNAANTTGTGRQKQKIGLLIASDMNLCARRFEEELPHLEKCSEVIDEGVSGLERLLKRTSTDDEEKLIKSREILKQFSRTVQGGIETFQSLRDTVAAMKDLSKDVSRASRRLAAAIDGIIKNLVTVQTISQKMLDLTDRLLQEEPAH